MSDIFDIDWMVDYKRAVRLVGEKVSVNGNFDPVSVLLQGRQGAGEERNDAMRRGRQRHEHGFRRV